MRRCPDASPQNQPHYFSLWCQSCPSWQDCGHGRRQPKNKKRWRGVGGRAQRLPPRCRVTRSIHTDVAAWVCLMYRLRSWNQPNCAYMRRCPDTSPQNQPHLRSSHAPTPPLRKKNGLGCGHDSVFVAVQVSRFTMAALLDFCCDGCTNSVEAFEWFALKSGCWDRKRLVSIVAHPQENMTNIILQILSRSWLQYVWSNTN